MDIDIPKKLDEYSEMIRSGNENVRLTDLERLVVFENARKFFEEEKIAETHNDNLLSFNRELYSHGVTVWAFKDHFVATNTAIYTPRKSEKFIYVPIWAVVDDIGLPSSCGNGNQRQLNEYAYKYFGRDHEGKAIRITDSNGNFKSYELEEAPFEVEGTISYWINYNNRRKYVK